VPWLVRAKDKAIVTVEQYLRAGAPGVQQMFPMKPVIASRLSLGNIQFGEDLDFRLQLFHVGLKFKLIAESYYLYRTREASASRKVHPDALAMYDKWLSSSTLTPLEYKYLKRLKTREEARFVCYPVLDNLLYPEIRDALVASLRNPKKFFLIFLVYAYPPGIRISLYLIVF